MFKSNQKSYSEPVSCRAVIALPRAPSPSLSLSLSLYFSHSLFLFLYFLPSSSLCLSVSLSLSLSLSHNRAFEAISPADILCYRPDPGVGWSILCLCQVCVRSEFVYNASLISNQILDLVTVFELWRAVCATLFKGGDKNSLEAAKRRFVFISLWDIHKVMNR